MLFVLRLTLLSVVLLIPLLTPNLGLGYEQVKVVFFIFATTLAGFTWLRLSQVKREKITFSRSALTIQALIFLEVLLITSLLGTDPVLSFLGQPPYFQGWLTYAYLGLFALLISYVRIPLVWWARLLTVSACLVGLFALKDWGVQSFLHQDVPNYAGRVVSTFGQPNFYAGFLFLCLPWSYFLTIKAGWWRKLSILAMALETGGVLVSGSRTVIFLLFMVFVGGVLVRFISRRWLWPALALVVLSVSLIAFYFSASFSSGVVWQEIIEPQTLINVPSSRPTDSVEKRFYIWPIFWTLINQKPFVGSGLETISIRFSDYWQVNKHSFFEINTRPSAVLIRLKDLEVNQTHNYLLDLLMSAGIGGLISWGVLVLLLVRKIHHWVIFYSLAFYLLWIQFQNQSIVHLLYFWLLLGITESGVKGDLTY